MYRYMSQDRNKYRSKWILALEKRIHALVDDLFFFLSLFSYRESTYGYLEEFTLLHANIFKDALGNLMFILLKVFSIPYSKTLSGKNLSLIISKSIRIQWKWNYIEIKHLEKFISYV